MKMKMNKSFATVLAVVLFIVLVPQPSVAKTPSAPKVDKFQITSGSNQQNSPAIFGKWVIYSDWAGGGVDLRIYNLKTKVDSLLVSKPGHNIQSGDIYRNIVVYSDYDGSQYDIYGIDLITKKEFPIAVFPGSNQTSPAIFGNTVVWSDNRNGNYDIFGYDLRRKIEFQITSDTLDNHVPRIWENKVVWYNGLGGGLYGIEGYDLREKTKFNISSVNNGYQQTPDIFANQVVWIDSRDGQAEVYYKNLKTSQEKVLTTTGGKSWPKIFNKYVTWVDDEGVGAHNIYLYDLAKKNTIQVSDDGSQQPSPTIPDIWGKTVVWMSWHTGNGDIYGARIK